MADTSSRLADETTGVLPLAPAPPTEVALPALDGYHIQALLGRGGMGRVFKARHRALGRVVAIKMLIDAGEASAVARFQAESQAVARLQHPNIAQIFETGEIDGQPFLVLEYLDGGSLAQKLAGQPQTPAESARTVEILARAIDHSHQHKIIHRDLKPANILLSSDGVPKITDFGLAKRLHEDSKLTRTGEILGTPSYMAPEQASGVVPNVGPAADIYALGAILYEMLTGRPPFQGPDSVQTLMHVLTLDAIPPRRLQPNLPRDLETICRKCLDKSPRKRYATATALADDLRRFVEGRPIVARPVPWWERCLIWAKRRPMAAAFLGLLLASVVGLIAGIAQLRSANEQLQTSNREAKASLALARLAIDRMLVRLSDQLAPVPQSEQLRRESLEDARRLYERLVAIRPDDREGVSQAADALGELGKIYSSLGQLDDAEATFTKAFALYADLKRQEPAVAEHRRGCANMLLNRANLEQKRGNRAESERLARAALQEIEPLGRDDVATLRSAAAMNHALALALRGNKQYDEATILHQQALDLNEQWLTKEPDSNEAKIAVALSHSNLATIALIRDRAALGLAALLKAEELVAGQTAPQQRFYIGQIQANQAVAYELLKKHDDAVATHQRAIATLTALVADYSGVPGYRYLLAKEHHNLGRYYGPLRQNEDSLRHLRIAGPMLEQLVKDHPDNQQFRAERDLCRKITGWVEEDLADAKKNKT